ncbi:energy transducer TonB [Hyphomonas sp. NPDC076900]|uniref:energy transducer TonB n=1 Tax=unclassified Hyphomonas TaxID=2630699 RepID=UPI003CFBFA15
MAQENLPDAEAEPLRPPQPVFPIMAGILGLSGYCEVRFSIDPSGRVTEIQPSCSHPVFCASATAAMEAVRFKPKRENGKLVPRRNIIYPLHYAPAPGAEGVFSSDDLTSCVDPRIA